MSKNICVGSLARISDLEQVEFKVQRLPRTDWETADYVVAEVTSRPGPFNRIELKTGRLVEVLQGDQVLGALGKRAATLEATGDWERIEGDRMDLLTPAGLFAKETSHSGALAPFPELIYQGHVLVGGRKTNMRDYAISAPHRHFSVPTILIVGTSMSAGKTTAAKILIRKLKESGLKVIGAKLTGAGRYRDVLSFGDAGADHIFDFVEMGFPSTVCPTEDYRKALEPLLSHMMSLSPDVMVAEVGASPLEPYNGKTAIEMLGDNIIFRILCASDPYAVAGIVNAFSHRPDLVTGLCASTEAGITLVHQLTGLKALNTLDPETGDRLLKMLESKLPVEA